MPENQAPSTLVAMPATRELLARVRSRLGIVVCLQALAAGLALAAAVLVAGTAFGQSVRPAWAVAALMGLTLAGTIAVRGWRLLTPLSIASAIERRTPSLDNLLVTTVELDRRARGVHALVLGELRRQTESRVQSLDAATLAPVTRAAGIAAAVALGAAIVSWSISGARMSERPETVVDAGAGATMPAQQTLTIAVTPPAYADLPQFTVRDSAEVEVLEGSRVRLELAPVRDDVQLVEAGHPAVTFERGGTAQSLELVAERSRFVLLRTTGDRPAPDRLLAVLVKADAAPSVQIRKPARDLVFAEPRGRVGVEIEASDDLALSALSLHYTRVFGSGENVSFQEGELPLRVDRQEPGRWRATSDISLEALKLDDGDTLVYRAMTRDLRPGRDPSISEAYLLEVGTLAQVASAGFALPADKDRHALSQQMVIVKTERLLAERNRLSPAELGERSRMLAVEQRMVRAEFVFMTGGEVQDEVAEAEHSHDLAEGRFENEGQVELLTAIREMSRAEARLNDAAIEPALVSERAALEALQRAFDRRRYLLRTMPERARIDQARRLSGELADARSWRRGAPSSPSGGELERLETLARDLATARRGGQDVGSLAARLGSLDPNAPDVQKAALALSAAAGGAEPERAEAIENAMRLLAERARHELAPAREWVPHDPAAGRYADALARETPKR